ncbi:hypothetical protein J2M53_03260 [Arthrobacter sp. zg-ZUI100]|uniref:hypothetical protein n=1 Tax=Arthrobacter jiangjiafuii TaxID=2817475 RepID=UPI001AEE0366|nr:hypothetical protein [Arthrobacter jiangjiafuii]MBP3035276.1 hypothetical protein [Arthrobacter jiangjiafuii]
MNQPPVENDARPVAQTPAPAESLSAREDRTRTAVLGPFGLRDTVVGGSVLIMLIGSLLPWSTTFGLQTTLWSPLTPLFFLGIGIILPLLVAGLFAARRMAPELKYRVGSLSVDQFGSVVAVLAVAFFFLQLVNEFTIGALVTFIGALVLVASTTLAPHIPPFSREFDERAEVPAHVMAREAVRLRRRPAPAPRPAAPAASGTHDDHVDHDDAAARPAGSRFAAVGKLAPAGLFGRKSAATSGSAAPAVNGIPADAAAAPASSASARTAGVAAPAASGASAFTAHPANTDADPETARGSAEPAAQAAPASRSDDSLAATTVNPVVRSGQQAADPEPATQVSPQVQPSSGTDSISATREESENVVEAFWFAVGTPRQIVDERTGLPLFMFHPGDWELGLEDRGHEFLVQDKRTGRIGVLRDLSNIERVGEDSGN